MTRAHAYGRSFAEYVATANEGLAVVLQIEHIDAVNDIDAILQTPGVAALFVGPFDLSGSMGLLGQISHPDVQAAIERVASAAQAAGMPLGLFVVDAASARAAIARGFHMIALGTDSAYLLSAATTALAASKSEP